MFQTGKNKPGAEWRLLAVRHLTPAVALAAVATWSCGGCRPAASTASRSPHQPLSLVFSGDTAGWITPCGCAADQSGGLARRATFVARLRKDRHVLLMDVGGGPAGTSPYQRVKFEAIMRGQRAMGVTAHNLGGPEVQLGLESLRRLQKQLEVPFVSANLHTAEGDLAFEQFRLVEAAGQRVLIVGVLSPEYATDEVQIADPKEAVLAALRSVAQPYDYLVVLAYLPELELRRLADELPEAQIVVGGPTGQSIRPTRVGPVLLASATNKGRFLVHVELPSPPSTRAGGDAAAMERWRGEMVELNGRFENAPEQMDNLRQYYEILARRDFPVDQTGLAARLPVNLPDDYRVAGTKACQQCHEPDVHHWQQTEHAHAWQTLAGKGAHVDAYCQQCHTTGFGLPGGFVSAGRSGDRTSVGCESCHGPSRAHVLDPSTRTSFAAGDQCVRCHDRENSPQFEYGRYWQQIVHGRHPAADTGLVSGLLTRDPTTGE